MMQKKIGLEQNDSRPPYSESFQNHSSNASFHTHPSMHSRDRDLEKIFKNINSDGILSRLPTRLDPNIQFSDDEDEEEPEICDNKQSAMKENIKIGKSEEKKLSHVEKTPEMRKPFVMTQFQPVSSKFHTDEIKKGIHSKKLNEKFYSSKAPPAKNYFVAKQSFFPQSEQKAFTPYKPFESSVKKNLDTLLKSAVDEKIPTSPMKILHSDVKKTNIKTDEVIEVNGKIYNILSHLGSGGSCKVYSVFDVEAKSRLAIKCVKLKDAIPAIREGYKKEIQYLEKLQDSNRVIKMYDYEYCEDELFIVLEHGDIDFAKYLANEAKVNRITPLMIKFYWAQMLEAVADIHKYGIVHSDLKPANFLFVAGNLKLIDFGIAASVPDDKTSTFRDDQVGTLNYMSPEAITQLSCSDRDQPVFKIGVKSDVWSLGCILYNLVYGFTPFSNIKTLIQKIHAITNPNYEIMFKPLLDDLLLDVLKSCLKRNPKERASVSELLRHPYLTEEAAEVAKPSAETLKSNGNLKNIFKQMQILTPRRMQMVTKIVQDLSEKHNT